VSVGRRLSWVAVGLAAVLAVVLLFGGSHDDGGASGTAELSALRSTRHGDCDKLVASLGAARAAVRAMAPGGVVCLRDGDYGRLTLSAKKTKPGVTLRAENPGGASIEGVAVGGKNITVAEFKIVSDAEVDPGSTGITIAHNRISGGYFGVDAGPTDTITVNDVSIIGNKFVGPFGEDAIRLNRYHDANGDGIGALIEGNEITGVRENGNHSDCLQTVWVGDHLVFRKNYLHDNRCQGFFVKDQASPVHGIRVEDNLILRDSEPCAPRAQGCGQPSIVQIFGPYTGLKFIRNTVWDGLDQVSFQEGNSPDSVIARNVISRIWTSTTIEGSYRDNTRCWREATAGGSWPKATPGEKIDCHPHFKDPAADDYRIGGGRGVTWAPAEMRFGP
jgi:Right handed beta helix region